jgi:hypothetical protein
MPITRTTTVNNRWFIKIVVMLAVIAAFGSWGLLDATVIYPKRGFEDASFKQKAYLERAELAEKNGRGEMLRNASIPDPVAKRAMLKGKAKDLFASEKQAAELEAVAAGSGPEARQAQNKLRDILPMTVDAAALRWLDSLAMVGGLEPERTTMKDPAGELRVLSEKWKQTSPPKALDFYDLPLQWAIMVVCYGISVWMLVVIFRTRRKVFGWDEQEKRLYLPGGESLVPGDVQEFDKRKWDKFYVTIRLKPGAGRPAEGSTTPVPPAVTLDLLRHVPLEEWVLEMERIAFPEQRQGSGESGQDPASTGAAAPTADAPPPAAPASA